jgi:hypothetical protein
MFTQQSSFTSMVISDDDINIAYHKGLSLYESLSESFTLGNVLSEDFTSRTLRIIEVFNSNDVVNTKAYPYELITDIVNLSDTIKRVQEDTITDGIKYSDPILSVINKLYIITEELKLNDSVLNNVTTSEVLSVLMVMQDDINFAQLEYITENLKLLDELKSTYLGYVKILDTILLSDTFGSNILTVVLSDKFTLGSQVNNLAILKEIITDKMELLGFISFDNNDEFIAYALNTQTSGVSEYTNFNFNSIDYPYAANSTGIYKLGDSDTFDGVNIDVSIKTGLMDFGTSLKKQVPYAYLGVTSTGKIVLKAITNIMGIKKEIWYQVDSFNTALDTTRIEMGKGVKAKYWQFEIVNIDGGDFELESMEVLPLVLKRRI